MTLFEQELAETPLRDLPPAWRSRLLPTPQPAFAWASFFRNILWPHPLAWGALAACWIAIFALNFSGPRGPELYAVSPPGSRSILSHPTNLWCVWQLNQRCLVWSEPSGPYLSNTEL